MRVLLLHPEDSPRRGPWAGQRWDLIVDLGRSSRCSEREWSELRGCRVVRSDEFREGIRDGKRVREIFSAGRGRLVDEEGIDWWEVASLLVAPEALTALALRRLAGEIGWSEMWATRAGWPVTGLAALGGFAVRSFGGGWLERVASRTMHYAALVQRFSGAQIKEIFLDKYDSGYRWRSRFAPAVKRCEEPVVLVPSAYGNVSRMAAEYAGMLPDQEFLMIATRESAKRFTPPANVEVRDLAAYARGEFPAAEAASLVERWEKLRAELEESEELRVLLQAGVLDGFPGWIRDGLGARNAWREVLEREPVCGVLCGDDSNLFTRLPVLLAARRKIATVDFHHGAFDGRYVLKEMACDVYLAKSEMEVDFLTRVCGVAGEKIRIAAPEGSCVRAAGQGDRETALLAKPARSGAPPGREPTSAVFFSEPYEAAGMRPEEVYREILPRLVRVAKENGRGVIVKLHPFESKRQRTGMIREVLEADAERVIVVDGPLSEELMARAWFGITVESTTVTDCLEHGVCCFLCGWLKLSPYEYGQQYARFGVGEMLGSAEEIERIAQRLPELEKRPGVRAFAKAADPGMLRRWLGVSSQECTEARPAS